MDLTKSILVNTRETIGLSSDNSDFDSELLMHINAAIGKLNQNGVGRQLIVNGVEPTWGDLQDPLQIEGNKYFQLIPIFITLSTKIIFDPPPPSAVDYHANNIAELLWRLKIAYEEPNVVV